MARRISLAYRICRRSCRRALVSREVTSLFLSETLISDSGKLLICTNSLGQWRLKVSGETCSNGAELYDL